MNVNTYSKINNDTINKYLFIIFKFQKMMEKLLILIMSIFLILIAGSSNIYPIYLQKLMDKFNFDLSQLNMYGSSVTFGVWMGFPIGLIYDSFGPKISILVGTILLSGGHLILHIILTLEGLKMDSIFPLLVVGFIIGQGNCLLYTTSITTNLKNFRFKQNSSIVGILVANYAISPSIFTTYRESLTDLQSENFYLYFSLFLLSIGISCIVILNNLSAPYQQDHLIKKYQKYKEKRVITLLMVYNMIPIFIFIFGVLFNFFKDSYTFPLIAIYPLMQLLNFCFVICEYLGFFDKLFYENFKKKIDFKAREQIIEMQNQSSQNQLVDEIQHEIQRKDSLASQSNKEVPFMTALTSPKLLLCFISLMLGLGSTLANLNNINFILKSLSYKVHYSGMNKGVISIYKVKELFFYVILYFAFNAIIRISSGPFLDVLIKRKKFTLYFIIFTIIGGVSQLTGAIMNKHLLYLSIALAGATHGAYMTFVPLYVKNEFGLKNMGKILGVITTGAGIGSFLVSELIFTIPYYNQAELEGGMQCFGKKCFVKSYIGTTSFFIINLAIGFALNWIDEGKGQKK